MVEQNTGLVGHVVGRMMRLSPGEVHDEAMADGMLGLMRAAQKYDAEMGYTFSTYAVFWIKQAIGRGREFREGIGFRQAKLAGAEYHAPVSLDAPLVSDADGGFIDLLADEDAIDPEAETIDRLSQDSLAAEVLDACRDDFDRALVLAIAEGRKLAPVAREYGYSGELARRRVQHIRERLGVVDGEAPRQAQNERQRQWRQDRRTRVA